MAVAELAALPDFGESTQLFALTAFEDFTGVTVSISVELVISLDLAASAAFDLLESSFDFSVSGLVGFAESVTFDLAVSCFGFPVSVFALPESVFPLVVSLLLFGDSEPLVFEESAFGLADSGFVLRPVGFNFSGTGDSRLALAESDFVFTSFVSFPVFTDDCVLSFDVLLPLAADWSSRVLARARDVVTRFSAVESLCADSLSEPSLVSSVAPPAAEGVVALLSRQDSIDCISSASASPAPASHTSQVVMCMNNRLYTVLLH